MGEIKQPPSLSDILLKVGKHDFELFEKYVSLANEKYLHWNDIRVDSRFKGVDIKKV